MNSLFKILKISILALIAFLSTGIKAQTISVTVTVKEPTCFSWTDGEATATATGGTAPYSYSWSNGQGGGQTVFGIPAGNYTITVTDAINRQTTKSFTVGQPPLLVPAVTVIGNSCEAGASYIGSATGGIPSYTYAWRNLITNQMTNGATLAAPAIGSYHLSVTDAKGCNMTKVVNVKPLKLMVITKPATCGGTCDGSAEAWVDGGTPPLTYLWSTGATTGIIFPLPGGDYTVTVTDALGCTKVATGTVFEPPVIKPNLVVTGQCSGSATATVTPTGGRPPLTIRWSTGATTNTVTNLAQGGYFVTITDSAGCQKDTFFKVSTGVLGLNITKIDANCSNAASGSATVNVTGGSIGDYSYRWSNGATTQTISNLTAGTYSVTVTDGGGCTATQSVNIQSIGNLVLQTAFTNTTCGSTNGTAAVISVSGGTAPYTYRWSNGATTPSVSNLAAGNYTVTATDASGCTAMANFTIQGQGNITIAVSSTPTSCVVNTGTATVTIVTGGTTPYTYRWSNGATTQAISSLMVGTYTVTVTDAGDCTSSQSVTIQSISNIILQTTFANATCGGTNGTATISSISGGTAPYTYLWSNGATTPSVSNLAGGNYSVTATDASGCKATANVTIQGQGSVSITVSSSPTSCGANTGMATVSSVSGGTAPYVYRWNNGATTQTISNVGTGIYFVTVTDAAGCTATRSVEVQGTNPIQITVSNTKADCNGVNGSATVTAITGGSAPYTYKWSTGATTASISRLSVGTYTVTVNDVSGCSTSTTVVIGANSNMVLATTTTPSVCGGATGTASVTNVTGGVPPYTYAWYNGGTTATIVGLASGPYFVTVTDAMGCTRSTSVDVQPVSNMVVATNATPAICVGSTGTATVTSVTGGMPPFTYLWSNGARTQTIINLLAGNYTVIVSDSKGCISSSATVVVPSATSTITVIPSISNTTCGKVNGQINISLIGGTTPFTYKWGDLTGTTQPKDRTGLGAGAYNVVITDANGCTTALSNLRIIDTGSVKAQFALQPQGCTGDSIIMRLTNNSIAQSANITYSWLFTGNRTSTVKSPEVLYGTLEGEARLVARSAEGCLDTLLLRFPLDVIKVDVPDTVLTCVNTPVTITANNLNPSFTPKYLWADGATTASTTVTPALAGTIKTFVTITNSYGCAKKDSALVVTVPNIGTPDLSWKRSCEPFKISFFNASPNANQWRWIFGDPSNPTAGSAANNPSYTYTRAGTFIVTIVPTNLSCLNSVTIIVNVSDKDAVIVDAGNDTTICSNNRITLRGTSSEGNFEWSNNRNFAPVAGTGATLLVTPSTGRNAYFIRSKNPDNCTSTDSIIVNNNTINVNHTAAVDLCTNINKSITVTNLNPADRLTVTWSPSSLISGFTSNDSLRPIVRANTDGILIGTFRNQFGCTLRDTIVLKTHAVDAKVSATAKTIYVNDALTLSAGPVGAGYTYAWSPAAFVTNPNAATTAATPKENTTYIVTVTDAFGCNDTAQVALRVLVPLCEEPYIFIPRAFSPNGDGTNDVIYVRGEYLTSLEFVIYNRWGEQVFATKDKSMGWDGKFHGQAVTPDVYGYYVKGVCQQGEQFFKKGNITVLK